MQLQYTIQNEYLQVTAAALGAELRSIRSAEGTEYLWQGDPAYWTDQAPNLFPYVGRLTGGQYTLDGALHQMDIHGFALSSVFTLEHLSEASMELALYSSPETCRQYPRQFAFCIRYALEGPALSITFSVENRDTRPMYFGLGGHPGFRVPLEPRKTFTDYRLRFSRPCTPIRVGFSGTCFRNGADHPFPLIDGQFLPLTHSLFDNDAIVLADFPREVTLESVSGGPAVTVSFPQMSYLGLWHRPQTDAPYLCIEPWATLPAWQNQIMAFEEQEDLLSLQPGESHHNTWSIRIHSGA